MMMMMMMMMMMIKMARCGTWSRFTEQAGLGGPDDEAVLRPPCFFQRRLVLVVEHTRSLYVTVVWPTAQTGRKHEEGVMAFPRPRRVTASSAANPLFANCMYFCLFLIFPISEDIRFISCHCFVAVVSFVFEVNTVHPSENIVLWFNTRNSKTLFSSFFVWAKMCEGRGRP